MSALLLALALAQASPAFDPADARAFARSDLPARGDEPEERLRIALIVNPIVTAARLAPDERAALEAAVGRIDAASANGLSWFFRGAAADPATRGGEREVAYYNPIVDAAVTVRWALLDGAWRLHDARLVDGAAARPASLAGRWSEVQNGTLQAALAARAQATAASTAAPAMPLAEFAARIVAVQRGLAALRADPAASASAARVVEALAKAEPRRAGFAAGNAPSAAMLAALPDGVRRSIATVAAYRRDADWLLLAASPLQPGLLLFVDLDRAARPVRLTPVNLTNRTLEEKRP